MGFNSVYQTLRELFPQVDIRLLKAVAIEHSKDPDVAVEHILTDVLPCIDDSSSVSISAVQKDGKLAEISNASSSMLGPFAGNGKVNDFFLNAHSLPDNSLALSFYDANDIEDQLIRNPKTVLPSLNIFGETSRASGQDVRSGFTSGLGEFSKDNCSHALGDLEGVSSVSSQHRDTDLSVNMNGDVSSPAVRVEGGEADERLGNVENVQGNHVNEYSSCDLERAPVCDSVTEQPSACCNFLESIFSTSCASEDEIPGPLGWQPLLEAESGMTLCCVNNQGISNSIDPRFTLEFPETDGVSAETETSLSTIVTRSGQICKVNLLEDIIKEAKTYKDTVCSTLESVVGLMEEVELKESEVEQAEALAARGGLDILDKAEEIKKMLKHAKEANDMHSGEVYGEKSILATEVKELQARLLVLSDEKDKSLSVLDEMRESLEERLAVAEERRRAAEQEMFDKQEIARVALAEQELAMDKVVQESKLLQQEADENAKLRDFLMEKGQVVDGLQGEISVICQDVKSLKENFDNRVSLTNSFSSSNSSVKSAATLKSMTSLKSMSSLKRTASVKSTASSKSTVSRKSIDSDNLATEQIKFPDSPVRMTGSSSGGCQTPRSEGEEEFTRYEATAQKGLSDEEWELCEEMM